MTKICFINHRGSRCGVHQYGKRVFEAIKGIEGYEFVYLECSGADELLLQYSRQQPDLILYNYKENTLPFLTKELTGAMPKALHFCLAHELIQRKADRFKRGIFDYLAFGDPSLIENNPRVFRIGRIIPTYKNTKPLPEIPTIGSYGFGGKIKGYSELIQLVSDTFEQAIVRINIPPQHSNDPLGKYAEKFLEEEQKKLQNPGIKLEITNFFLTDEQLLDFLAGNSINVLFYNPRFAKKADKGGISSMVDDALAVNRSLAVSSCHLFRHLFSVSPSIVLRFPGTIKPHVGIAYNDLNSIIKNGTAPLESLYAAWTPENFSLRFSEILTKVAQNERAKPVKRFNRVLDDAAREEYHSSIERLFEVSPEMMERKIARANVQQGFMLDTVKRFSNPLSKILSVGSFEDTACETLLTEGYQVDAIDPEVNCDLGEFCSRASTKQNSYSLIFSTSVIEHVEDDELFLKQIVQLLKPGGIGVLTFDLKNDWRKGDDIFDCNYRFYNEKDLYERVLPLLENCELVDDADWQCDAPDFEHSGKKYTFGTLTFRKK
jgi:SAM-dependent methyltransferase